ncbi:tumor necrosis factor receptor superfamily member 6B-like [Scleropages formosus]|uniref:TNFR-Cys domain-containing protein n=1 Tax=Scleropages formosus TaxID=113540 RepID=A0A8C9QVM0_SCLFO|nr:tumor necrosis factor receptor superfamily member 6B [Scleropages formosus]
MRTLPLRYVWFALLAACASAQQSDTATTYQWNDDVTGEPVTCERCPPGTFVRRHCGTGRRTECGACPELHYTEFWNYVERCRYCSVFCSEQQYEKVRCSSTHNRVCECKDGYYMNNGFCSRHRVCPAGEGVSQAGTAHSNVKCEPCPDGFFSQKPSSTEKCRKHSRCQEGEKEIPGTKKQDTFCTLCTSSSLATASSKEDRVVCDKAVMEYVVQQPLPPRKLKRLENVVKKMAGDSTDGTSLLHLLVSVQKKNASQPFVNVMVDILRKARLHHLEDRIRRWFLDEDYVFQYQ